MCQVTTAALTSYTLSVMLTFAHHTVCWILMRVFLLSIFLLLSATSSIVQAFSLQATKSSVNPISQISVFEDPTGLLTLEQIQTPTLQQRFLPPKISGDELSFGFSKSTYWIKIPLSIARHTPSNWILEISYFGLDHIDFYAPNKNAVETGGLLPVKTRPIFYRHYAFPLDLTEQTQNFYLKIRSDQTISIPIKLWEEQAFNARIQTDTLWQSLYYGGLGVLAIFNFFIFIYLRDRSHLYYSLFALSIGFGIFAGNGLGRLFLWPNAPLWDQVSQTVLLALGVMMALFFTAEFLKTRDVFPALDRALRIFATVFFIFSITLVLANALGYSKDFLFLVFPTLVIPMLLLVIFAGIYACKAGQQSAKFFLLAWGVLCIGGLAASLRQLNLIPSVWFTSYALQISSAIEMLLLSFALASRIQHERILRESAQLEALSSKEALVQSLMASEERLEKQVSMRTNDLRTMLESEKKLREQYIRFGSLISHEFRSPLGIIETQTALLSRQTGDDGQIKRLSIISSATHRLALLFDRWLQGDRLESKIDSDRPQLIQLNTWLNDLIDRCKQYHPNHTLSFTPHTSSPILVLDEKMLEVVILNLIDNACKYSPTQSIVKVKILLTSKTIGIAITDSGIGIDPSNHQMIFDEFVQIKTAAKKKGYGLGLSFVKKVMVFYGGEIEVISELGKGAEFIAWFSEKSIAHLEQ